MLGFVLGSSAEKRKKPNEIRLCLLLAQEPNGTLAPHLMRQRIICHRLSGLGPKYTRANPHMD